MTLPLAGYSGRPLAQKLAIRSRDRIAVIHPPQGLHETLAPLPPDVTFHRRLGQGRYDVIVAFFVQRARLAASLERLKSGLDLAGGLWLCWPKRTSGVETDLGEGLVRELGLRSGLVDNKICAVDERWSGLRFVYRVADRPRRST
jgi:hypothetical protein